VEILKNNFFLLFYAVAFALALTKLPKYYDSILKYFPILIAYTLCTEFLGMFVLNYDDINLVFKKGFLNHTKIIYNIYDIIFFTYFYYLYWNSISNQQIKKLIKYGAVLFLISMLINILIKDPFIYDMWYAYTFGVFLLIVAICYYLYAIRKDSFTLKFSNLLFWISIGTLVFHMGYLPIMIIQSNSTGLSMENARLLRYTHLSLIVIMYVCYIIGFLVMKRMPSMKSKA